MKSRLTLFSVIFFMFLSCNETPKDFNKYYKFVTSKGKTFSVCLMNKSNKIDGYILTDNSVDSIKISGDFVAQQPCKLFEYADDGSISGIYEVDFAKKPVEVYWSKPDGKMKVLNSWVEVDSIEFTTFSKKLIEESNRKNEAKSPISPIFWGNWKANCENSGYVKIGKQNPISIEVNSNQIYITAIVKPDENEPNRINVFLKEPDDLGRGGMSLEWASFSRDKPIATIQIMPNQPSILNFLWYGFYNNKSKTYNWVNEPDWNLVEGYRNSLVLCND